MKPLTVKQRTVLIQELVDTVGAILRNRADEVLKSPEDYGGNNPTELRWQIFAAVIADLEHDLGDQFEENLRVAQKNHARKRG
jgi:hypothetical protein